MGISIQGRRGFSPFSFLSQDSRTGKVSWEHVKAFGCCYDTSTLQKQHPTVNSEVAQVFSTAFLGMAQGEAGRRLSSQAEQRKLCFKQPPPADQVPPELLLLLGHDCTLSQAELLSKQVSHHRSTGKK